MSKKLIAIIISLVVVIGGGIGTYFYFTNTPKNKYLLSEKQSYDAINSYVGERFEQELAMQKGMSDESYKFGGSIHAEVPDALLETVGIPASMVNSSKIELSAANDPDNKTSQISINPTLADSEIGNIVWSADKSYQYIEAPLLTQPLKFKNSEIIKGIEKLTGESIASTDGLTNDTLNLNTLMTSSINQEDIDEITGRYLRFILEEIKDENFTKGSGEVTVLGEKKKLDSVTINLKAEEVRELLLAILKEVKSDKDIKKIVAQSDVSIEYEKELENIIKEVKDADKKDFPTIESTIYVDGKDIQKRLIAIELDGESVKVELDTKIDKDIEMKLAMGTKDEPNAITIEGSSKGKDTVTDEYKLTLENELSAVITNKETLKDKTRTDEAVLKINEGKEGEFVLNLSQKLMTDVKNNKQTSEGIVSFDVSGETVKIHLDSNSVLKEALDLNIKDAQDINTLSDKELEKIKEDASSKMMGIYFTLIGAAE